MSNMADTSLAAFKRANVTRGQQKIIEFLRARPRLRPTRQEIADLSGWKLQSVCGRVNELIYDFGDTPWIRELPVRDGAHPLELIEHEPVGRNVGGEVNALPSHEGRAASAALPTGPKKPAPVWVTPVLEHHRMSMTVDQAKSISGHQQRALIPAELVAEADAVLKRGRHWVAL